MVKTKSVIVAEEPNTSMHSNKKSTSNNNNNSLINDTRNPSLSSSGNGLPTTTSQGNRNNVRISLPGKIE